MAESKFSKNLIRLRCSKCNRTNYYTRKNKKLVERKLDFSKYCMNCRVHATHKEGKK